MVCFLLRLEVGSGRVFLRGVNFLELPQIMGVLNVTPDSFSDGGQFLDPLSAIRKAHSLVTDGADIVDVGAQSTRPGCVAVSASEEILRIRPVLEKISKETMIPVSVDTFYPEVASLAANFGIKFLNATYGLTDVGMVRIVKSHNLCCVINYCGHVDGMKNFFLEQVNWAKRYGISENKIYLDPGIGFGKTFIEDFNIITNASRCRFGGYPVMLGVSRKRVVRVISSLLGLGTANSIRDVEGLVNRHEDYLDKGDIKLVMKSSFFSKIKDLVGLFEGRIPEEFFEGSDNRDFITGILNIIADEGGVNLLRVHNVKLSKKMFEMYREISLV